MQFLSAATARATAAHSHLGGGAWPKQKSMQRVLRYDGLLPTRRTIGQQTADTADHVREMHSYIDAQPSDATPFDIVVEGRTGGDDSDRAAETIQMWANAGATWWIEAMWGELDQPVDFEAIRRRIQQGPPRFAGNDT